MEDSAPALADPFERLTYDGESVVDSVTVSGGTVGVTTHRILAFTPDGDVVTASETEHSDLLWGLKGGGGTFGVVTAFEFDCHRVGPEVATCLVFYPATELERILRAYGEFVATGPDEISTLVFAGELPEAELFDGADVHRQKFAIMGASAGPPDEGERALAPLREFGDALADVSGCMPYAEFQALLDEDYPDGMRYYWKSLYLAELSDAAIERVAHWAEVAPSPLSTVDVWELGGAIAEVDRDESAFPGRDAPFLLGIEANWEDPAADDANVAWVRDCFADMRRFSDGSVYLNFPGFREDSTELREGTFGPDYERLVALKDEYDSTDMFGATGTIKPSKSA